MGTLWQDLKYGARQLARSPGFTAVAVLTLALGIGATTAIFSVVNAVLLRPLPYPEPERLVLLLSTFTRQGEVITGGSALPDYRVWRDQSTAFEGLAGFYYADFALTGAGGEPERLQGARVTPNLLQVIGVRPALGRSFLPGEEQFGQHRVVILSHGLWQRRYGGDASILNRQISLGGYSYTVVGVMPEGFPFFDNVPPVELLTPISFPVGDTMDSRNNHFVLLVGRLKPGVTLEQAQAEVSAIARRMQQDFPQDNAGVGGQVSRVQEQMVANARPALLLLLGAVGLVLLVACVNVANLLLARGAARERELAIRACLGASRWRLVRHSVVENVPLALVGGAAGLLPAVWGVDALVAILPVALPRFNPIALDATVLAFALGLSFLTVFLFGMAPAWQAFRADLREALVEGGRGATAGRRRHRTLNLLATTEIALALVLLTGAGLLLQSFWRLQRVDPGFKPENVLVMSIPLAPAKYSEDPLALRFYEDLLARLSALPEVRRAGVATTLPLGFGSGWGKNMTIEHHPVPASMQEVPLVQFVLASEGYFAATGIPVRQGRSFTPEDTADSQPVAIVNEALARRYFPGEDPLGKTIIMLVPESLQPPDPNVPPENRAPRRTIVGVLADVKDAGLGLPVQPTVFVPYTQFRGEGWINTLELAVRTTAAPESAASSILAQLRALDPDQPVTEVATLEELVSRSLSQGRFTALLVGLFALVTLLLAGVGIFGVMAYAVAQRTHEFGIRIALGAQMRDVSWLVLKSGLRVVLAGVLTGVAASLGFARLLASQLYDVRPSDPATLFSAALGVVLVALAACYIPAWRATRVDPMTALRYE